MDVGHLPLLARLSAWNSLPEDMRDPDVSEDSYRQSLRHFYLRSTSVFSALEFFKKMMRYINPHLTFDIPYNNNGLFRFAARSLTDTVINLMMIINVDSTNK